MNKLQSITKACKITDQIFSDIIKNFSIFNSEKQISNFIIKEIRDRKLRPAFAPIVATGKNAAEIHHKPTKDWYNGFCVIDLGVRVNGYCSDMTRTIFIGKPSVKEKLLYDLLLNAQISCIKKIKPGISCKELARYNVKMLGKHKNQMIHALGHGVGKYIHTKPKISLKSNDALKKGDIITIEPGIYYRTKYGIRIEDTLTATGKILTRSRKELYLFK